MRPMLEGTDMSTNFNLLVYISQGRSSKKLGHEDIDLKTNLNIIQFSLSID